MDPLADLRDIHLPPDPALWPPAPGWWLLAALLAVTLVLLARPLARWRRRRRLWRHVESTLDALHRRAASGATDPDLHAELSALLRRVALLRHPREQVAGITGTAWLEFLDRTGGGGVFAGGAGRLLVEAPYRPPGRVPHADVDALLAAARRWLRSNCR